MKPSKMTGSAVGNRIAHEETLEAKTILFQQDSIRSTLRQDLRHVPPSQSGDDLDLRLVATLQASGLDGGVDPASVDFVLGLATHHVHDNGQAVKFFQVGARSLSWSIS
jgi:hypothetical protein